VKRGYDPEEVDKYISTLEQVIKSYKDKDNAIKNAIISAQVAADNVVRNAQMHADAYKVQIGEQLVDMRKTLDRQRMSLQAFQESYARIVRQCIQELEKSDMSDLFTRIDEMEAAISDLQGMDAPQAPTPVAALPDNRMDPRADNHPEYLGHDRNYGHAPQPEPRDTRPQYEAPRDYPPAPARDMAPAREMYEDPREAMRASTQKFHDSLFETDKPFARDQYEPDPPRGNRDMAAHDAFPPAPKAAQPYPAYDTPKPDPYQGGHMREEPQPAPQPRVAPDPYQQAQGRDPRDMMPHHDTRMQPPPAQDSFPAPPQRDMRDIMPHDGRDFMPEPANLHQARDTRRDAGRDMRGPVRSDVRRDPARDMMRPPERAPMRDNRQFMQEPDSYDDDDQNLLPPVASLM